MNRVNQRLVKICNHCTGNSIVRNFTSSQFKTRDEKYKERVEKSFAKQTFMNHLGAYLSHIAPGEVDVSCNASSDLLQQHGFFHGGVTTSIADSAAGYAAYSLFAPGSAVLTTEFKINLLNPAQGDVLVAEGRVIKPGKTLSICRSDVYALKHDDKSTKVHVATGLFSMMQLEGVEDET